MYPGRVEDKSLIRLCSCSLVGWRIRVWGGCVHEPWKDGGKGSEEAVFM
jgi:hypothetical protein